MLTGDIRGKVIGIPRESHRMDGMPVRDRDAVGAKGPRDAGPPMPAAVIRRQSAPAVTRNSRPCPPTTLIAPAEGVVEPRAL